MDALYDLAETLLGLSSKPEGLSVAQVCVRAAIVYIILIVFVRFGKKRFLGEATAFDAILVIIIGSVASRAISGTAPFFSSLIAVAILIAIHWIISLISRDSPSFSSLINGNPTVLIKNGRVDRKALRDVHMSDEDLDEDLRREGVKGPAKVAEARLERDGKLSVLKK
jgi:uncharacterized membrane protein YcaP (DUF421 family)